MNSSFVAGRGKLISSVFSIRAGVVLNSAFLLLSSYNPAFAAGTEATVDAHSQFPNTTDKAQKQNGDTLQELTLDDMNDVAILLDFISEQSKNIYQETIREPVGLDSSPDQKKLDSIPVQIKEEKYLPARLQWLVFYLGIMEPVLRELVKQTRDIETGAARLVVPKSMESYFTPLWKQWTATIRLINKDLDGLVPLFDEKPLNVNAVRERAVAIHSETESLNELRRKIFLFIRDQKKSGNKDKIMVSPL